MQAFLTSRQPSERGGRATSATARAEHGDGDFSHSTTSGDELPDLVAALAAVPDPRSRRGIRLRLAARQPQTGRQRVWLGAVHLLAALDTRCGIVVGQTVVDGKSNEPDHPSVRCRR